MKGGTRSRAISRPLISPGMPRDQHRRDDADQHRQRQAGRTGAAMLVTCAATTAASPMMKPTDRSMPPEMMTKVWPSASSSGADGEDRDRLQIVGVEDEGAAVS